MSLSNSNFLYSSEQSLIRRLLQACVLENLLPHFFSDPHLFIWLDKNKKILRLENTQQLSLGRLKINGSVQLSSKSSLFLPVNTLTEVLNLIQVELGEGLNLKQWAQFLKEIRNCARNCELVESFKNNFNLILIQQIHQKTFLEYIKSHPASWQLMFFEQWAMRGHPYHPCHKTKLGFNKNNYLKFSPEFHQDIKLPLACIEKKLIKITHPDPQFDYLQWFAAQFPPQYSAWLKQIHSESLNEKDFYPFFIHPWQYSQVITTLFSSLIESKKLQLFEDIYLNTKPSLSFRTLITGDQHQPHIKLPTAVQSTSAMRTISPASVNNGPVLSKLLKSILKNENHFDGMLQVAQEICGLHVIYDQPAIAKHLGIIYRQNPASLVQEKQMPVVVAALFETTPLNKEPFFIEILKSAGCENLVDAKKYFANYARIVLHAFFDLFLLYGIALEGHQQNTLAVFENDQPVYMIARDLGGIRIYTPVLKARGFDFHPYPYSAIVTDQYSEVIQKFIHTVLQYHLGELVLLLSEYYSSDEKIFWKIIKGALEERFHHLRPCISAEIWAQAYTTILHEDWKLKGLMRMRLSNVYSQYLYVPLPNPLRNCDE